MVNPLYSATPLFMAYCVSLMAETRIWLQGECLVGQSFRAYDSRIQGSLGTPDRLVPNSKKNKQTRRAVPKGIIQGCRMAGLVYVTMLTGKALAWTQAYCS